MIKLGLGINEDEVTAEEPTATVPDEILPFEGNEVASHMEGIDQEIDHTWKPCALCVVFSGLPPQL